MRKITLLLTLALLTSCSQYVITEKPRKTLIIAHKGVWKDGIFPSNTTKAFDESLKRGFDGFELDAVLTADNQFLVIHDKELKNTTNCKGKVEKTNSSEIKHCSSKKNSILPLTSLIIQKTKNRAQISLLKEVFARYLPQESLKKIVIDIKSLNTKKTILALKNSLPNKLARKYSQKIIYISQSATMLKEIKKHYPRSFTAIEGKWGSEPVTDYATYLNNKNHDMVSLNAELMFGHTKISKNFFGRKKRNRKYLENYLNAAKKSKIPTMAWTINNKSNYHYLLSKEVEFILTDLSLELNK